MSFSLKRFTMKYVKSASEPQLVGSQPRIIVLIIDYEDECDFDDVYPSGQAGQSKMMMMMMSLVMMMTTMMMMKMMM